MDIHVVKLNNRSINVDYDGRNVLRARIYNKEGDEITDGSFVLIEASKEGLIGLGSEIIRMAYEFKNGYHEHISPIRESLYLENMGVFATSDSSEIIISCNNGLGKVGD
ncbi:hypothetical protein K0T92_07355 [Paenibacillus oenotherae]|uniref:Uncharacterized protein n=1 Tax=Paenibacillus oenotherae TaxID=1435645 RepID=A0ABS7D3T5_9BACL|nr:hypothetical protein [Paenibacillus oenotherae]MBW7474558.1 hypothetical protein [Paenibacillus oenotherae]